ncbi:MAG: ABC transporter substrate-binding protein [Planctomycetes bacterium]|nr:ABC transporter substrate-binding protein [Planctomycetota bacterium]
MHARPFAILLGAWLAAAAAAQQPVPRRCGVFLWHESPNDLATLAGIRAGLQQAGVAVAFVEQHAAADAARATAALTALREARCDLVFALGTQAALLAKEHLRSVPIVFAAVSDAVASGVVADWNGSGTNLCGASNRIGPAAVLDAFRLAVPQLGRLGVIRSRTSGVVSGAEVATMRGHLAQEGAPAVALVESVAVDTNDVERAVRALVASGVEAIWIPIDLTVYRDLGAVRRGLGPARLPLLTTAATGPADGAHVGVTVDYGVHGRRAAALAVRVLQGAAPGSLPIDRMQGTLVKVNLGAARRDGIELPLSILAVADELLDDEVGR